MSTLDVNDYIIEIKDLDVEYKTDSGKKVRAVDRLSLHVQQGEVVGFIGPNGAGKSTTIKVLAGFRRPTAGSALVFGKSAGHMEARRRMGYLPEVALYYPFLTARETLDMFATLREIPRQERKALIDDLLRRVGLSGRDREPLAGFSKGMLQRVGIAQAIMGDPDLLVLDEVTSGLDPVARYDVRRILLDFKSRGKTVFFSSHELSEVTMLCDRVILIDEGKVIEENSLEALLANIRRRVVRARCSAPNDLPEGVYIHSVRNGTVSFVVDNENADERFSAMLTEINGEIVEEFDEAGSLEDFFVQKIGHKVT